jgi:long-subunit fatty acid transport protein
VDVRWVDFAHTTGVGTPTGFNPDGSISAPGWKSVFTVASGVQFCVSESLSVRLGYLVNGNPIPDEEAFFNAGGAAIYEHSLYIGASYQLTERLRFSGTYVHILPQSISGPFFTPAGAVPGSLVRIDQRADLLDFGFSVNY